ncbi:MAG TPA: hypothetical protein VG273_19035 [Bryobacteraceae bacterium]|jgi:hypothetical protein|nr:hypothetical protein [Bryobacteraceae bacterium]
MLQSPILRYFQPGGNPLGFAATDFIALALAALLALLLLFHKPVEQAAQRLATRTILCMTLLAGLPVVLRLILLVTHPVPTPRVSDDFSFLLLGDTLAHFRLANPMHPMHRFFEGVFTLQVPTWSSSYPPGQGIALAIGQFLGNPWIGVVVSVAALPALCYWMLRAWIAPEWAMAGGILTALEFGPLSPWMNTYWGGAVSAIGGCLVFGAIPRIKKGHTRAAILLGGGLGIQMLSRPYEFVLLLAAVAIFWLPRRALAIAALACLPATGLTLLQNKAVTGKWTELPYQLSRYQYGIPTTFTFQAVPVPHQPLTLEQQIDYEAQAETHGNGPETAWSFIQRLGARVRFFRFFFLAPLYLALPFFLPALREARFVRVAAAIAVFWIGTTFYPYFYPHYIAAAMCLFVLISVKGLEQLSRLTIRNIHAGEDAARIVLLLCVAHFVFWYGVHLSGNRNLELALRDYESWNEINTGDPEGRVAIDKRLADTPGKQLVFVRYFPRHGASEWIHNAANIDGARVVWALDLGPEEDEKLRHYYPGRTAWLLEPDAVPPRLSAY